MIITPASPSSVAFAKLSFSHAMSAALRASYSFLSGAVSHRLLQEPWMLTVTYMTPFTVQRRFSTQGVGPLKPRQLGVDCTSCSSGCCPSEKLVLKNTCRSWSSRSSELYGPFFGRSQSVQSLSPG